MERERAISVSKRLQKRRYESYHPLAEEGLPAHLPRGSKISGKPKVIPTPPEAAGPPTRVPGRAPTAHPSSLPGSGHSRNRPHNRFSNPQLSTERPRSSHIAVPRLHFVSLTESDAPRHREALRHPRPKITLQKSSAAISRHAPLSGTRRGPMIGVSVRHKAEQWHGEVKHSSPTR